MSQVSNGIGVMASVNGRPLSLAPVMEREPLVIQPVRVENSMPAGLRLDWISGSNDRGLSFDLTCGAGVGSPYMTLTVSQDGEVIAEEVIDMAAMLPVWVDAVLAAGPTARMEAP